MSRRLMAVGLALAAAVSPAWAYREGDSQLWLSAGVETGAGKDLRLGVDAGSRWGDSMSEYFYQSYEPYVNWKAASWLEIAVSEELIKQKKNDRWLDEQVPKLTLQIKGEAGPLTLSNRSRMEFRIREDASDEYRYRDRVRLQLTKGLTGFKIRPFVEDEVYFSVDEQRFNENRAAAGLGAELHPRIKGELYYLVRSQLKDDLWTDSNVAGVKIAITF